MENQEEINLTVADAWESFRDDDILVQQSDIIAVESEKVPFIGDKVFPSFFLLLHQFLLSQQPFIQKIALVLL